MDILMQKCHSIMVTGKVQDIGFRSIVEHIGRSFGIPGMVFNAKERKLDKANVLLKSGFDNLNTDLNRGFDNVNLGLTDINTGLNNLTDTFGSFI
ncbi:MAG TPA: acylphosphatase, partial [Candidatus Limnocylindrales bacterium]|nr:acylphosphatase [Candidatus Limnocylindrales bacterium]